MLVEEVIGPVQLAQPVGVGDVPGLGLEVEAQAPVVLRVGVVVYGHGSRLLGFVATGRRHDVMLAGVALASVAPAGQAPTGMMLVERGGRT